MAEYTSDQLNEVAMQIIMHAGDGRDKINKALIALETGFDFDTFERLMEEGHEDIVKAHRQQTEVIQSTVEDDNVEGTLLFAHAQDTLMTINSEYNLAKHIGKLYQVIAERGNV